MLLPRDIKVVTKLAKLCVSNPVPLRCKHVAALVDKNKIISLGLNKAQSDPGFYKLSQNQKKQFIHAEWDCLNNVGTDCSRLSLYVVRVNKNGELAQSKPCLICQKLITKTGIKRVVYTVNNGIALL